MLHVVIILSSFADPHVILKLCNGLSSVEQFFCPYNGGWWEPNLFGHQHSSKK